MTAQTCRAYARLAFVVAVAGMTVAGAPAHAFESSTDGDMLERGPSMGPIDAERPAPKYITKDRTEDVTGIGGHAKDHEDFNESVLDLHPLNAVRLPRWGVELRVGPYRPDFAPAGQNPGHDLYDLMFVTQDKKSLFHGRPIMMALEADGYLWRGFGLLGVYGRVGYWRASGPSRLCLAADGTTPIPCSTGSVFTSTPGNDTAALTDIPLSLGAVWRLDALRRRTVVPLIFTAKAGLDYHMWWGASAGRGAQYRGHAARGATLGYQGSVGVSLNLDGFARRALSRIRSRVENNLFIEYAVVRGGALNGPGRANRPSFSDHRLVTVGLACDFK